MARTAHVLGAFVAWLMLGASSAHAAPELFVDIGYEVDPSLHGCPSADELRGMVGQQLGYDPHRTDATLRVEIRAQAGDRGIDGAIDWSDSTGKRAGERRFTSRNRDCHELMATMGFVVAVQIRLLATDRTAAPPPASAELAVPAAPRPVENPPVPVEPAPAARFEGQPSVAPTAATTPSTSWSAIAGIGPSVALGLGPNPTAQGRLFAALEYKEASFELGAEASLPTTSRQNDGSGFRQNLVLGTMAACGHHRFVSACGVGKLGQIRARGLGVDVAVSRAGFVAQVGPRLALRMGLGDHLLLSVHADVLYLLTPWTVSLNETAIWTMPRFGALVGIDLAARLR